MEIEGMQKRNIGILILGCCMAGSDASCILSCIILISQNIIYEERLNQMEEITRQMFQNWKM